LINRSIFQPGPLFKIFGGEIQTFLLNHFNILTRKINDKTFLGKKSSLRNISVKAVLLQLHQGENRQDSAPLILLFAFSHRRGLKSDFKGTSPYLYARGSFGARKSPIGLTFLLFMVKLRHER